MRKFIFALFALTSFSAHAVPSRTVMLQLFNWPWAAIGEECTRVLGPAGYSAVQVSPPQEHIVKSESPWWERYQPVSYKIDSRSGNEAEFAAMVRTCKQAGVDIYADVVLNHMNAMPHGKGFAGTMFSHYAHEGVWSSQDFHYCGRNGNHGLVDFRDLYELQSCELLGMSDLNTGAPHVQRKMAAYLNHLLDLGVAGFRVDAAKHISAADLLGIFRHVSRPHYRVLELILTPGEPIHLEDYLPAGDINDFAYAYAVGDAFTSGDLGRLFRVPGASGIRTEDSVVFTENHDLERRPDRENLLTFVKDPVLHKLGSVFLLTWPYGYPQIYSGYAFSDPDAGSPLDKQGRIESPLKGAECARPFTCVHRFEWMKNLVAFRNQTDANFAASNIWADGSVLSFGRGVAGHVVISADQSPRSLRVHTSLKPGSYCNLLDSNHCAIVDANKVLKVELGPKSAFVVLDEARTKRK